MGGTGSRKPERSPLYLLRSERWNKKTANKRKTERGNRLGRFPGKCRTKTR